MSVNNITSKRLSRFVVFLTTILLFANIAIVFLHHDTSSIDKCIKNAELSKKSIDFIEFASLNTDFNSPKIADNLTLLSNTTTELRNNHSNIKSHNQDDASHIGRCLSVADTLIYKLRENIRRLNDAKQSRDSVLIQEQKILVRANCQKLNLHFSDIIKIKSQSKTKIEEFNSLLKFSLVLIDILFLVFLIAFVIRRLTNPVEEQSAKVKNLFSDADENGKSNYIKTLIDPLPQLIQESKKRIAVFKKDASDFLIKNELPENIDTEDSLNYVLTEFGKTIANYRNELDIHKNNTEKQLFVTKKTLAFSEKLKQHIDNVDELYNAANSCFLKESDASLSGIYIHKDTDKALELISGIGYEASTPFNKKIKDDTGLYGKCFALQKKIHIKNIPKNYFSIATGLGKQLPIEIVLIPIRIDKNIYGIVELAFTEAIQSDKLEITEHLISKFAIRLAIQRLMDKNAELELSQQRNLEIEELKEQLEGKDDKIRHLVSKTESNEKILEKIVRQQKDREGEIQDKNAQLAASEEELRQNIEELQTTQEDLAVKEAELRSIIDAIAFSTYTMEFDLYGKITEINDAYLKLFKRQRRQMLSMFHEDITNIEKENYAKFWNRILSGSIEYNIFEYGEENETVWLSEIYAPILNSDGQPYKVFLIGFDVTENKRQQELLKSQSDELAKKNVELEQLSIVARETDAAIIIMDAQGNYKWVNQGFTQMYGLTYHQLIKEGKNLLESTTSPKVIESVNKCLQDKKSVQYEYYTRIRPGVKIWVQSTMTPTFDDNGKLNKLIVIESDITKQKRAEKEILKKNLQIEKQSEKLVKQSEHLKRNNAELEKQKAELESILSELKSAQSQLVQSEKMATIGQLTAGIAHEINNPVNYIKAGIDALHSIFEELNELLSIYREINNQNVDEKLEELRELQETYDVDEILGGIHELSGSIKKGAERAAEIVKGLRTFSRLDEEILKESDIHENIESTLVILRNQYKNRIEIVKNYGKIPYIRCYPGKLNQVFMNILVNAMQAIEDKGTIKIITKYSDIDPERYICIHIKDDGKGMTSEVKNKIFDPFFTTKEVGKGTGLGMSISYSIINDHKGKLEFTSEIDSGTEFIITLPIDPSIIPDSEKK